MSKVRVVRERIDPRLTAALFANYRTPIDAILELVDNAVDSRVAGRPLAVELALRPGSLTLTATGGRGMGPRELERDGALQTTEKRLAAIMREQAANSATRQQRLMDDEADAAPLPAQLSFAVYRVNDYDLQIQHNEAVNLAVEHLGIERLRTDSFLRRHPRP